MDKRKKIDVDDEVDEYKHQSDIDVSEPAKPCNPEAANESNAKFTTSSKHEGPFTSDPFAVNYRPVPDLNHPRALAALRDFPLTHKQLAFVMSAEWAEKMRPFDQFNVRLKERGLLEEYHHLRASQSSPDEMFERLQNFFQNEAPDLMGPFLKIWDLLNGYEGQTHGDVSKL
ncbi:MAG: hypothetical protein M1830_010356 [Pleopsidium flavum]|nr:MAG: hypothetical protein M1830_010356 [Pleopsidium flavum]